MDMTESVSIRAQPAAPYSARPPSPPSILIPTPGLVGGPKPMTLLPSIAGINPNLITAEELSIITDDCETEYAHDSAFNWAYNSRRTAQMITKNIYLGPSTVARDQRWLKDNKITMLLAVRDSRMAGARLMAVDKVAKELGIRAEHVDVEGYYGLMGAFPSAVRQIVDHALEVHRGQQRDPASGELLKSRVLVFCETGNDRSAGIVAAYLMAILGQPMIKACQFIHYKRFCVSFEEDLKQVLKNYEDVLNAQRVVHTYQNSTNGSSMLGNTKKNKRNFEQTMDVDDEMGGMEASLASDRARFTGRHNFVPFIDPPSQ
ncbi:phosphatases II [Xylariaceae sp. FL0016]|nr:phosphatases II [Xylariaceae sp. FL0016]